MRYSRFVTAPIGILLLSGVAGAQQELGEVDFPISCTEQAQREFDIGLAQLHHMMYEQARPHFAAAAQADPQCAMAHWGIAMTSFQPLWHPTTEAGFERGKAAVQQARALGAPTERELAYVGAVEAFFTDPVPPAPDRPGDHAARTRAWMESQREVHQANPEDADAAAFYALASVAYAMTQFSPAEETDHTRQRTVGALLERYLEDHPRHPGLHHYLIHAYDSPELAHRAEEVAHAYDHVAPETVHALHMPSHIFVRLGRWQETAEFNERSAAAALRHLEHDPDAIGHYVHALDYAMYAYLQMGDQESARRTLARIHEVDGIWPVFAFAYGLAAPQARYYLERRDWEGAARLEPRQPAIIPWDEYPAAEALFHYARGIGAARIGDLAQAEAERARITDAVQALRGAGDTYWAYLTQALGDAVQALVLYERGETDRALTMMREAADLEDSMDKHPITPGEVFPVRELYGDLLLREGRTEGAIAAYEASLERTPNRRNAETRIERAMAAR